MKREPEIFAACSKSIRPSASPSSKCSFGAKPKSGRVADAADLDIGGLVRALGHVVERHVRNARERVLERLVDAPLGLLALLDRVLDLGDLADQRIGRRLRRRSPWPCRSPWTPRCAGSAALQPLQVVAPRLVELDELDRRRAAAPRRRSASSSLPGLSRIHLMSSMVPVSDRQATGAGVEHVSRRLCASLSREPLRPASSRSSAPQRSKSRREGWSAGQDRSATSDRAASAPRRRRRRGRSHICAWRPGPAAEVMPARTRSVATTGSWNTRPKAKISVMISDRYSETRGRSWIAACPPFPPAPSTGRTTSPSG